MASRLTSCILPVSFLLLVLLIDPCFPQDAADDLVFQAGNQQSFKYGTARPMRYLLYEINPGEGFNLRRDVYMRVTHLVKELNREEPWTLVLPPWGHLYHWQSPIEQQQILWKQFFDLESLGRHVPVMEFEDYIKVTGKPQLDEIYYLQRFKEGWKDGKWEEKMEERKCTEEPKFKKDEAGRWRWWFWGYEDTYGESFKCLSIQAQSTFLAPFLLRKTSARSVFIMRAEELIHGGYSEWSPQFWTARRSLRFAKHLRDVGDAFRESYLDSTDAKDNTVLLEDWTQMQRQHGDAIGGPYVAAHLRRRDFLYGHPDDVPSLLNTARQLEKVLQQTKLNTLFIASDAPTEEFNEIKKYLKDYSVFRFVPTAEELRSYKDGGIAIIDQWICAHARYFIGTSVSTFTFRIHEEREILGFDPETTFNRLCGDKKKKCEQPTKWMIKYH